MKFRKIISSLVASVMLISALTMPVNALEINGGSGTATNNGGSGQADWDWSTNCLNRTGYRISFYFAPVAEGSNIQSPTYDWTKAERVGNTIDVKAGYIRVNNDPKTIIHPDEWGTNGAWQYLEKGGPMGQNFNERKMVGDYGQTYYYYQWMEEDKKILNDPNVYVCAVFNKEVLNASDKFSQAILDRDYDDLLAKLEAVQGSVTTTDGTDPVGSAIENLKASRFIIDKGYNYWTIPMVSGNENSSYIEYLGYTDANGNDRITHHDFRKAGANDEDGLNYYLMNPTILNLLGEATGGNFTAEDFYFGRRRNEGSGNDSVKYGTSRGFSGYAEGIQGVLGRAEAESGVSLEGHRQAVRKRVRGANPPRQSISVV